jgi:hypothetical protein
VIIMAYRHTQSGRMILTGCLLAGLGSAALTWRAGHWLASLASIVIALAVAIQFSSLTVEVGNGALRWYFGPGLWSYRLSLDAIREVAVVRNHWWHGWGIRMAPGFRLYNVSGFYAVELYLGDGEVRRIGTDDPQGLFEALLDARRQRRSPADGARLDCCS